MTESTEKTTSRRAFVTTVGGGAAALVAAGAVGVLQTQAATTEGATGETGRRVQYGMVIDTRRCIGCHACSVACKAEFDVPLGYVRGYVEYVEKGDFPNVRRSFLPRLCNHCTKPHCVRVCPTGATYKRPQDGTVVIDQGVCIGCKYCIMACPYGARFLNPVTRFADKCDFCIHRVSKGEVPSCVDTCQGRARIFGDVNDPESEVAKLIATQPVTVLRRGKGTEPNVYYIAADTADENLKRPGQYVRVTTHQGFKVARS